MSNVRWQISAAKFVVAYTGVGMRSSTTSAIPFLSVETRSSHETVSESPRGSFSSTRLATFPSCKTSPYSREQLRLTLASFLLPSRVAFMVTIGDFALLVLRVIRVIICEGLVAIFCFCFIQRGFAAMPIAYGRSLYQIAPKRLPRTQVRDMMLLDQRWSSVKDQMKQGNSKSRKS